MDDLYAKYEATLSAETDLNFDDSKIKQEAEDVYD